MSSIKNINKNKIVFSILFTVLSFFSLSNITQASDPSFEWVKQFKGGGSSYNWPGNYKALTKDNSGNIYIIGVFNGTVDFDPGEATANLTSSGKGAYVVKLDSSGNFVWAKSFGNVNDATAISLDTNGNIYITGLFSNTSDFDPSEATSNLASVGDRDSFILKLDSSGNFVWAKSFGGVNYDGSTSMVTDSNNIYISGVFSGTSDFDPSEATSNLVSDGNDAYILKLDLDGNFVWAKNFGNSAVSLSLYSNNLYITGEFSNTSDFDPGEEVANLTSPSSNTYILKLTSSGNFVWAKSFEGIDSYSDSVYSLSLDSNANVYLTGYFTNTVDFDPGTGTNNLTSNGDQDIYIVKLDSSGNFVWAKNFGGTNRDKGIFISNDSNNNVYVTGIFNDTVDFDPGEGSLNLSSSWNGVFILKLDSSGNFVWAGGLANPDGGWPYATYIDSSNNLFLAGEFFGTADMDPGEGINELDASVSGDDTFILKLSQVTPDTTAPVITLTGATSISLTKGTAYTEQGATATDDIDGDITSSIVVNSSAVNIDVPGTYTVTYNVDDAAGNHATQVTRTIIITEPPVRRRSSGSSVGTRINNLINAGNIQAAEVLKAQFPESAKNTPNPLNSTPVVITKILKSKSSNDEVKVLQIYLNNRGFTIAASGAGSPGHETNYFGNLTKQAVMKFQKANGLTPDGIVGPKTKALMK